MSEEISRLGLEVDTSSIDKAGKSFENLISQSEAAARAAKYLDETLAAATGKGGKNIDDQITKLKQQAAVLGLSATQAKLVDLATRGATAAQVAQAKAIYETIDAFKAKEEAARRAEAEASKNGDASRIAAIAKGAAIGTAIGQGISFAIHKAGDLIHKFEELTLSASKYKDLEETFGSSAEGFAAVDVAAKVAGTTIDEVANFTGRLTRGLAGIDDETKNAGAALKRLGINVNDFKTKEPVAQLEILGKALSQFKDGAAKTELIGDLGGRGAARILPFLKELNEEGGRNVILTQAQIDKADEYKDAQARASGTLDQYLKLIALEALPGITGFTRGLIDVAKELLGVDKQTGQLKDNHAIRDWAEEAAVNFAKVIDFAYTTGKALIIVGKSFAQAFEDVKLLTSAASLAGEAAGAIKNPASIGTLVQDTKDFKVQLAERNKNLKNYNEDLDNFLTTDTNRFENAVRKRISDARAADKLVKKSGDDRPELEKRKPKAKDEKGQLTANDLLGFDIQTYKNALKDLTEAQKDQESILEAVHSAGILEDKDYYGLKLRLLRQSNEDEIAELQQENARRQRFIDEGQGTQKDRLKAQKDIQATESEISRKRDAEGAKEFVLEVQRRTALDNVTKAYREAQIAAEQYLDTIVRQHKAELDAFGKGDVANRRVSGSNQILERYQSQRDELNKTYDLLRGKDGALTTNQQEQLDARLKLISEFQDKALSEWDDYFSELRKKENDSTNGFNKALQDYSDNAGFTAKNVEGLTTSAFKGMEDGIVNFVKTGKLSFKDLIDSFVADIIRLTVQQELIKPISSYLSGTSSDNSNGSGLFGSLIGAAVSYFGGGSGGEGLSTAYSGSGAEIRGRRALGGPVSKNGLYQINEDGQPEILSVAGKKYLMTGNSEGSVKPQKAGSTKSTSVNINQSFAPGTDRRTINQAAAEAKRQLMRAERVT